MKKILITGGAGYIGGYLTDILAKAGNDVTVYDNLFKLNLVSLVQFNGL